MADPSKLRMGDLYPVHDRVPGVSIPMHQLRARWTGVKRPPKAGEFYLSGALIEAWRAPNDLSTDFHIAEIVEVRQRVEYDIQRIVISA